MASGGVNNNGNGPRLDDNEDVTGTELLKMDLEKCPPWRINSANSDHRSVSDFLNQFWFEIGSHVNDPDECLARLVRILDVSEETRFMSRLVNIYIRQQQRESEPCTFPLVKRKLRLASWDRDQQIVKRFSTTTYDRNVCGSMIRFVTFWYKKLKNIATTRMLVEQEDILRDIHNKLPDHFREESMHRYGRAYPESLLEFCEWAGYYEAKYHTDEALGNCVNLVARVLAKRTSPSLEAARTDTTQLFLDMEMCAPWRVNGSQSDHRSVIEFLQQFHSDIGRYISDRARRLARFARILDASVETQFMVEPIAEYIVRRQRRGKICKFSFAEGILVRTFWNKYHRRGVLAAIERSPLQQALSELDELKLRTALEIH